MKISKISNQEKQFQTWIFNKTLNLKILLPLKKILNLTAWLFWHKNFATAAIFGQIVAHGKNWNFALLPPQPPPQLTPKERKIYRLMEVWALLGAVVEGSKWSKVLFSAVVQLTGGGSREQSKNFEIDTPKIWSSAILLFSKPVWLGNTNHLLR